MTHSILVIPHGTVERLATPSNLRLGREIADQNAVEVVSVTGASGEFRVGGGTSATSRRSVRLSLDGEHVHWSCTCTKDESLFCKHVVAACLAV